MSMDGAQGVDIDTFINEIVLYLNPEITGPRKRKAQEARDNAWKRYEQPRDPSKVKTAKQTQAEAFLPLREQLNPQMDMSEFLVKIVPKLNQQITEPYRQKAQKAMEVSSGVGPYYDPKAYATWKQSFDARLQTFSDTVIKPLAEAHVACCEQPVISSQGRTIHAWKRALEILEGSFQSLERIWVRHPPPDPGQTHSPELPTFSCA